MPHLKLSQYTSEEHHKDEMTSTFHNSWTYIAHKKELTQTGECLTFAINNESYFLICNNEGKINGFANRCRHRSMPICASKDSKSTCKKKKHLKCPYHNWSYDLDGRLLSIPFAKEKEINRSERGLIKIQVQEWKGFLFVNLDLKARWEPSLYNQILQYVKFPKMKDAKVYQSKSEIWNCNWKVAYENAIESYHLFSIHKQTLEPITPTSKSSYVFGNKNFAITKGDYLSPKLNLFKKGCNQVYYLVSLPPSLVLIFTEDSLMWVRILPRGVDQCEIVTEGTYKSNIFWNTFRNEEKGEEFMEEDRILCESLQKNLDSQYQEQGPVLDIEKIINDFHLYLAG